MKISIHEQAKKTEAEHIEAVTARLIKEHEADKKAARLEGKPAPSLHLNILHLAVCEEASAPCGC